MLTCRNKNPSNFSGSVRSFHDPRLCTGPDLDHSWDGSHQEGNFKRVNDMLHSSPNNGFIRVNAETEAPGQTFDHDAMGYYDDGDLPFYYDIAKTLRDQRSLLLRRDRPDVPEPRLPRGGHLVRSPHHQRDHHAGRLQADQRNHLRPPRRRRHHLGRLLHRPAVLAHLRDLVRDTRSRSRPFATDAAAGTLPQVAFVDGSFLADQTINGSMYETDEHPPADIRAGQYTTSQIITALRNSPNWNDSILFLTYDEHGGYYDHVKPAAANQGGAITPDGIAPGQCADASNLPASAQPGGGASCTHSATMDAPGICDGFTPTGPYPADCSNFNQLGFRVPLIAISPFSKPHYVSHVVNSHTSFLALLERRFSLPSLTARDANANDFEDMFDFDNSPSLNSPLNVAAPLPRQPPAFSPGDGGCPFS